MGGSRLATTVAGVAVVLLAALAAATSGGLTPLDGPWQTTTTESTEDTAEDTDPTGQGQEGGGSPRAPESDTGQGSSGIGTIARVAAAALAIALLLGVLSLRLVRLRRISNGGVRRIARRPSEPAPALPESEDLDALLMVQLDTIGVGTARNAVVEIWLRLEDFFATHGLPRDPADTPAEFVSKALATYDLDDSAIQRLADLYREARFSTHPLSDEHRTEARSCLERLVRAEVQR